MKRSKILKIFLLAQICFEIVKTYKKIIEFWNSVSVIYNFACLKNVFLLNNLLRFSLHLLERFLNACHRLQRTEHKKLNELSKSIKIILFC